MMLKQLIAVMSIAALGLVGAQDAPSACAASCVTGVFANGAATMGCANGDTVCVCNQPQSLQNGIRDCINAACPADSPDVQIPLADAYGNQICAEAKGSQAPASASSTAALPFEVTSTTAAPTTTPTAAASTTSVASVDSTSQSTVTSSEAVKTVTSSSAPGSQPTTVPTSSSTTSASLLSGTSTSSSLTTSNTSQPTSTSGATTATTGTSTAVKAGIGAGVGAAALAAVIIAVCACLRRRQRKKTANRVRKYKISEPMSGSGHQFANDIGRAEAGLPKPIITTHPAYVDPAGLPTSPTSVYSNSSELETHARRYEDMVPRTQPRTMI
ncbi:hypothetical protein F5Y10DRAFT_209636 [Nemania abortiva]|nr:hypothetical protein F5Y10DRAFT_209636 [Nemania abortiva]